MARHRPVPSAAADGSLLSPVAYDDDASSLHSRSDQESDSEDDQLQQRARNSRELRAHDRIVLMEEEEMDRLVTSSRRQQRRGSGLNVPNPLRMFGRSASTSSLARRGSGLNVPNPLRMFGRSASTSSLAVPDSSTEDQHDLVSEKWQARRARRKQRRNKMLSDARHGEDGELMYEMEEGDMDRSSSTGESTPRSHSAEADRHRLGLVANAKAVRGRGCRRFCHLHLLIVTGFAILALFAWKLSKGHARPGNTHPLVSNGTALFAPTTIILSLDGFRADFLHRGITPRLNAFIKEGVSPAYMRPSFPSVTFPNHYTLATGLYPESHGVVGNTFWDPDLRAEFYYTDPTRSLDPKWWSGEPFWVTAELQGIRTAVHMWPGSQAHILHVEPSFLDEFDGNMKLPDKVARILEFIDMPGEEDESVRVKSMRPQLIAAYVPNVDLDGHTFGPNSTEIRSTIKEVDQMLDQLFQGLEQRNLTHIVNVIVVSDHGMATTDTSRLIQLEDLVDTSLIEHTDGWPLYGLRPKNEGDLQTLATVVKEKAKSNPNVDVYLRDEDMPERYHFSNNQRIAPLWIVPKPGWAIVKKDEFNVEQGKKEGLVYHPRGLHGYDHEHPLMRAIFVARGPAFPHANGRLEPFQNIEVYNILADSVGMTPRPNNGTLRLPLRPIGKHDEDDTESEPADPPPTSVAHETSQMSPQRPTLAQGSPKTDESTVPSRPTLPAKVQGSAGAEADETHNNTAQDVTEEGDEPTSESIQDRIKAALSYMWDKVRGGVRKGNELWEKVRGGAWTGS
ncbi:hypothetical protein L249_0730 [Ophiocordyceps polyrhachis-furcata BCC 54312]|uniref:Uncharacterized protein n=1 Tax=Ophiocordyceps polyrhachis-furcata BCC 54312 TaxID=1330021 RepID=A0A367LCD2_9HYPO|nr:hypothetical protein L249_0730 [Ophiocordyceps polyrhachis-furcata BCC 54312]